LGEGKEVERKGEKVVNTFRCLLLFFEKEELVPTSAKSLLLISKGEFSPNEDFRRKAPPACPLPC
jgi:hypothetical protein